MARLNSLHCKIEKYIDDCNNPLLGNTFSTNSGEVGLLLLLRRQSFCLLADSASFHEQMKYPINMLQPKQYGKISTRTFVSKTKSTFMKHLVINHKIVNYNFSYFTENWSAVKRRILIGYLSAPHFALRWTDHELVSIDELLF